MSLKPVLIMAGGTGGHVYPALAIAEYLREQGVQLFWLGTKAGLESRVVPENNIKLITINVSGLRGKHYSRWLIAPFVLLIAVIQSMRVILTINPSAVIGMGGFVSGPGGLAAWLLRVPLYIQEQNSIAGLTNKLLSRLAKRVMLGFPDAMHGKKVITIGNPVRKEILSNVILPADRLKLRQNSPLKLLVLGGSLGATILNELLPKVVIGLPQDLELELWHQTGLAHHAKTLSLYKKPMLRNMKIVPYIENMADAYLWADIVLCRAGALTISELSVMGVASILVPYPHAADDHQTMNARYLSESGGAILIKQIDLNPAKIIELISKFYVERETLIKMATAAQKYSLPNATKDICDICMGGVYV
jgi:UDP-N-acetylglucosamine--N-acetylmuramyl-(pentapeptide) pyrophosphoryl-undecaprenol N-acetylglucosamine transferase